MNSNKTTLVEPEKAFVTIIFHEHEVNLVPLRSSGTNDDMTINTKHYLHLSAKNSRSLLLKRKLEMTMRGEMIPQELQKQKYLVDEICEHFQCSESTFWATVAEGDQGLISNRRSRIEQV